MNKTICELRLRRQLNKPISVSDFFRTYIISYEEDISKYYTQTLFATDHDFISSYMSSCDDEPLGFISTLTKILKLECKNSEHLIDLKKHEDGNYYVYKIKRYTNEYTLFIEIRIPKEDFELYANLITIAKEEYFENKEELK